MFKRIILILALICMIVSPVFGQTGTTTTNEYFYLPLYGSYGTTEFDEYNTYMQIADTQIEANKDGLAFRYLKTEMDSFSKLQAIIADKTLVNVEDGITATAITDNLILKADFADEDWGDMTVATNVVTIDSGAVTYAKIQNVSATDKVLGRATAGAGVVEEIVCTSAGRALIDDADASAQRTTLGLVIGTDVEVDLSNEAGLYAVLSDVTEFIEAGDAIIRNYYSALGSDHTYSDNADTDSQPVGENVVFGDLLYFNWTDKEWKKAKADAAGTTPALVIALETKGDGDTCLLLRKGYIRDDDWNFTASMVYLSDTTAGGVLSVAPSDSGDQIQRVGQAKSADILFFDASIDVGEI